MMHFPLTAILTSCIAGDTQLVLRLKHAALATQLAAGQYLQLQVQGTHARITVVLLRINAAQGWIEGVLPKNTDEETVWETLTLPSEIQIQGCYGTPWQVQRALPLLIGEGVGSASLIALADVLKNRSEYRPLILLNAHSLPFSPRPSQIYLSDMPAGVIAAIPLLEDWKIASRLASEAGAVGCFEGSVCGLAEYWLGQLAVETLSQIEILATGDTAFLTEVAQFAAQYDLPIQCAAVVTGN